MSVFGRLDATLDARPIEVRCNGSTVLIALGPRAAWESRRAGALQNLLTLIKPRVSNLRILVGFGGLRPLEVFPNPGLLMRLLTVRRHSAGRPRS